eukprot:5369671-Karenia_brevis.AAC.1
MLCIRAVQGYRNRASPRSGPFSNGWWNTSCLVNLGFKLLQPSSWVPVPAEKDAGFALIRKWGILHILRAALRPQWYTEDPWVFDPLDVSRPYTSLCKAISRAEDDSGLLRA